MWIAWVAVECRPPVGRVIWPKRFAVGRERAFSAVHRQGSVALGDSNLSVFDGPVAGLACLPSKFGESESFLVALPR